MCWSKFLRSLCFLKKRFLDMVLTVKRVIFCAIKGNDRINETMLKQIFSDSLSVSGFVSLVLKRELEVISKEIFQNIIVTVIFSALFALLFYCTVLPKVIDTLFRYICQSTTFTRFYSLVIVSNCVAFNIVAVQPL